MKIKITNKFVKSNYAIRIYCDNLRLLQYLDCKMYNCGVYGWNYDLYEYKDVALLTGYRNIPYNVRSITLENKYNKLYNEIDKSKYNYNELKEIVYELLDYYIEEITKTDESIKSMFLL